MKSSRVDTPSRKWNTKLVAHSSLNSIRTLQVLPLIGIATTKTSEQEFPWRCLPVDECAAHRTMRRTYSRRRFCQVPDFISRPPAKRVSQWVVAASKSIALAANRALGVQIVIATVQPAQFQPERPIVLRTSDCTVLPELPHDLMRLFY